jgi:DNA-binding CsgD family transcriptional regulator
MAQFPRLSNREWDVLKLLLQGKSNKLIALSLDISIRTVEFHLKNIYAKFQVRSRIELILKLGNTTGEFEIEKLGYSTVVGKGEIAENRDKPNLWMIWAIPFKETVSIIGKELNMKNIANVKPVFMGVITALIAVLLGGFVWKYSPNLSFPLIIVLAVSGLIVGVIGKRQGESLIKVLFSVALGTGLSPLIAIPLMVLAVFPIGAAVVNHGIIDLSKFSTETATNLAMSILFSLWLISSVGLGVVLLKVFISKRSHGKLERSV